MDSATARSMQGKKNPICARAQDDPRILRFKMLDGRQQAKQKLYHEQLLEEGRREARNPKPKETQEEGPLPGLHAAIARFDALWAAQKPAAVAEVEEAEIAPGAAEAEEAESDPETAEEGFGTADEVEDEFPPSTAEVAAAQAFAAIKEAPRAATKSVVAFMTPFRDYYLSNVRSLPGMENIYVKFPAQPKPESKPAAAASEAATEVVPFAKRPSVGTWLIARHQKNCQASERDAGSPGRATSSIQKIYAKFIAQPKPESKPAAA